MMDAGDVYLPGRMVDTGDRLNRSGRRGKWQIPANVMCSFNNFVVSFS